MLIIFIIGLCIGSFLNVIIDRLPRKENILVGRSHCDFCHKTLLWYDMVPIFSFVLLGGKCRYCRRFLGWKYPLIELTTGICFTITYVLFQQAALSLLLTIFAIVSCLIVIFYTDLFSGIIPDKMLLLLFFLGIFQVIVFHGFVLSTVVTAIGTGILFLSIFLLTKGKGIGFGDVKFAFVMGLLVGFPFIIPTLYIAFLTGAIVALILVIVGKKGMKSSIAFGPFLVVGTLSSMFFGIQLWILFQKILGI